VTELNFNRYPGLFRRAFTNEQNKRTKQTQKNVLTQTNTVCNWALAQGKRCIIIFALHLTRKKMNIPVLCPVEDNLSAQI